MFTDDSIQATSETTLESKNDELPSPISSDFQLNLTTLPILLKATSAVIPLNASKNKIVYNRLDVRKSHQHLLFNKHVLTLDLTTGKNRFRQLGALSIGRRTTPCAAMIRTNGSDILSCSMHHIEIETFSC